MLFNLLPRCQNQRISQFNPLLPSLGPCQFKLSGCCEIPRTRHLLQYVGHPASFELILFWSLLASNRSPISRLEAFFLKEVGSHYALDLDEIVEDLMSWVYNLRWGFPSCLPCHHENAIVILIVKSGNVLQSTETHSCCYSWDVQVLILTSSPDDGAFWNFGCGLRLIKVLHSCLSWVWDRGSRQTNG